MYVKLTVYEHDSGPGYDLEKITTGGIIPGKEF
jgi:hypothetical protein